MDSGAGFPASASMLGLTGADSSKENGWEWNASPAPGPSFPRKRESIFRLHQSKMDSRLRGNDGLGERGVASRQRQIIDDEASILRLRRVRRSRPVQAAAAPTNSA